MYKRASFGVAAALVLSACSTGSGVTPVQNGTSSNVQSVSVQRTEAASSLSAAQAVQSGGPFGGAQVPLSTIVRQGAMRLLHATGAPVKHTASFTEDDIVWGPCSSGYESGTGTESMTDLEVGARTYYDAACTQLAEDSYVHLINNTPGSTTTENISISGTLLKKTQSGTVVSWDTLTGTATGTVSGTNPSLQASLLFSHAPNQSSSPTAQYGESCGITLSGSGAPQSCGVGNVAHVQSASADYGVTMNLTMTSGETSAVTGTVTTFSGAYNALTLAAGTFPAWTISGGQSLSSATLTGTQGGTGSYVLTDAKADATVTMSVDDTGSVTGTIKRTSTGASEASFTVDAFGNGTITYSNGTTATISDWIVTG